MSFDIISSPARSEHAQCVDIPDSPEIRETVGMALLPKLDHCAAGLVLAVNRRNIIVQEDRPSNKEQVRVTMFRGIFSGSDTGILGAKKKIRVLPTGNL